MPSADQSKSEMGFNSDLLLEFFHQSPDAIIITELKSGTILEVNQAFEKLYGGQPGFVKGKTVFNLGLFRLKNGRENFLEELEKNGKAIDLDGTMKISSGEVQPVSVSSSIGTVGKITFIFSIIRDIAERYERVGNIESANKNLSQQVTEAEFQRELLEEAAGDNVALLDQVAITKEDLEILNKQKDKFFSIIAHDLKSPFSAILGFSTMLKDNIDSLDKETIAEYVNFVHQSAENSYAILNDLLDWAMSQMGRITYDPQPFNIADMVKTLDEVYTPLAKAKGVDLVWEAVDDLQSMSDRKMVETVIRNLVNNSIKFTDAGGVITVKAQQDDNTIKFSISDSGVGMSASQVSGLFEITKKSSTQGTKGELGTGLGLSLCQEFVHKHGGKIRVTSEVGKGSCFSFTIPNQ